MCACSARQEDTFRYSVLLYIKIYTINLLSCFFVAVFLPFKHFLSLVVNMVIFMYSLYKLMYELPGYAHYNIPATVHKSTSEHLAVVLACR